MTNSFSKKKAAGIGRKKKNKKTRDSLKVVLVSFVDSIHYLKNKINDTMNLKKKSDSFINNSSQNEDFIKNNALLTEMIGVNDLQIVFGRIEASTEIWYSPENGKWTGSFSMLGSIRIEVFECPTEQENLNQLNTVQVIVSPDLSVSYYCENSRILHIPFAVPDRSGICESYIKLNSRTKFFPLGWDQLKLADVNLDRRYGRFGNNVFMTRDSFAIENFA